MNVQQQEKAVGGHRFTAATAWCMGKLLQTASSDITPSKDDQAIGRNAMDTSKSSAASLYRSGKGARVHLHLKGAYLDNLGDISEVECVVGFGRSG